MVQKLKLKYWNATLNIALNDWRNVYSSEPPYNEFKPEVHRGRLVYRLHGSSKRISYAQIKNGLQKQTIVIEQEVCPF